MIGVLILEGQSSTIMDQNSLMEEFQVENLAQGESSVFVDQFNHLDLFEIGNDGEFSAVDENGGDALEHNSDDQISGIFVYYSS